MSHALSVVLVIALLGLAGSGCGELADSTADEDYDPPSLYDSPKPLEDSADIYAAVDEVASTSTRGHR